LALKYKNSGKLKAKAIKKVNGIIVHQYFILSFKDSYVIQTKNVIATTEISAEIDFAGMVVTVCAIKLAMEVSSADI
jgi:hypothetical protein